MPRGRYGWLIQRNQFILPSFSLGDTPLHEEGKKYSTMSDTRVREREREVRVRKEMKKKGKKKKKPKNLTAFSYTKLYTFIYMFRFPTSK